MKKLVLAMVFILLMALFIAFNYLLWDRDSREKDIKNLEYANANNTANINAQSREIKSLEDENSKLQASISDIQMEKDQLLNSKNQIATEKENVSLTLAHKIEIINALKQSCDIKVLETPVRKWADSINEGTYNIAYDLEYDFLLSQNKSTSFADYSDNLRNTVKSINIKSTKLITEAGMDAGEIDISATLDVKLVENADTNISRFINGLNDLYFKLDYNANRQEFVILNISTLP